MTSQQAGSRPRRPSLRHLNYKHLHYFWVVAREGSITRAAERLFLTPQTVSGQLAELETSLGEKLFLRTGRRLQLTELGRVVFQYADEMFQLGAELKDVLDGRLPGGSRKLDIGIADAVPKLVAYRIIQPALRTAGTARIVCHEGKLEVLLAGLAVHRYDLVLADSPIGSSVNVRAYSHLLGESGVTLFARRSNAARLRRGFPASLTGAPMLMPAQNTSLRRGLESWLARKGVAPTVVGEFDDTALMKVFGEAGVGVFAAATAIEADVLRQFDVGVVGRVETIRERYYAITAERKLKHPAVLSITHAARGTLFAARN